jgi:hypothetical protein
VPKVPKIEKKKDSYGSGGMVAICRIRSQLYDPNKPNELNKLYKPSFFASAKLSPAW